MSRLESCFPALRSAGRSALIPYIVAGDPHPDATVELMHTLVTSGADAIELGVPFSDPQADGPVIQDACQRALAHGVRLVDVLALVAVFRERDTTTPVVLMGYLNPIESLGVERFAEQAQASGVDGVLVVDQPPEEGETLQRALADRAVDSIFLLSPTTADERLERIGRAASGFVYYVSLKGVTGAATLEVDTVAERVEAIRAYTTVPVGVGFGIRDAAAARRIGAFADAVVVGSALVEQIGLHADDLETLHAVVGERLAALRAALDESTTAVGAT